MLLILSTVILLIIGFWYLFTKNTPPKKLPPNVEYPPLEEGWPILGVVLSIKRSMYHYFTDLSERLGPIYMVKFGVRPMLVINNCEWFKKCFKDDADNFSGRSVSEIVKSISHNSGIIMQDGEIWSKSRSFALRVLKDFGVGKSRSEEIVQQECGYLLEKLDCAEGQSVDFAKIIAGHTLNIISQFLMNKRFDPDDENFKMIQHVMEQSVSLNNPVQLAFLMFPRIENSSVVGKSLLKCSGILTSINNVHEFFFLQIEEHRKHLAEKSEGEDLMDRFLMEQQNEKVPSPAFKDWQLVRMSFELCIAGYETTSTTLTWAMMLLSWHPEAQEEMFEEIRDQVGLNRRVSMADKKNLHFCQAVLDEVGRLHTVAPMAVFHRTLRDTVVGGRFFVPANTFVVPNIFGCHRDPAVWEQPHNFYPDHFLHRPDEQQQRQYRAREELVMFGMGRRQCLGESLARTELLVFLAALIQRYRVEFATSISRQQYEESMRGQNTIIRYSNIHDFCFHRRLT